MNVPQEELNEWAQVCQTVHGRLHAVLSAVKDGSQERAAGLAEEARAAAWMLKRRIERSGAEMPNPSAVDSFKDVPLELLDTPANRRYARALRDTWEALKEVERERGIEDGASEVLEDWLAEVEQEIYGPAEERGGPCR